MWFIKKIQAQEINLDFGSAAEGVLPDANFNANDPQAGFNALISNLLEVLMAIAAIMVFGYLIWGAYDWITSAGDKSKIESAQKKMTQAVIGILVLSSTLAIFMLLQNFLGLNILKLNNTNNPPIGGSPPGGHNPPGNPGNPKPL